jgi:copper transport protein
VSFIKRINHHPNYLLVTGFLIIAMLFLISTSSVYAHSSIQKTIPNSGELLKTSPSTIELWFQDEVEVSSNSITLSNREGEEIQLWSPQIDTEDRRHISVLIEEELPPGYYTVDIRVLALDGDPLGESYQFAVEKPQLEEEEMWRLLKLEKSFPEDGTIVKSSPEQIDLWFTQPAQLSAFGLFDDHQRVVSTIEPHVDPSNPKHYRIEMKETLPPGTYTINWYARIGGKEKNGIIYFAVDEVSSIVPPKGIKMEQSLSEIGMLDVSKWLIYLGLLTLFGGTWFSQMIVKQKGNNERWRKVSFILYGLSIAGLLLLLFQRWNDSFQISYLEFISLPFIWIPILQILLLSVGYWLTKRKVQLIIFALTVSLWAFTGHAALPRYGGSIGVGIDALHLFGISIWMGGLFALLIMTPKENSLSWLKEAGKAYSKWALISIFIIIFTGIWMTVNYVPTFTFESLFNSEWGKMLWIKVVLLLGIIALGFLQHNSLKRLSTKLMGYFLIRSRIELIIGVFILFAAAILVNLSPTEAEQGIYPKVLVQEGVKASVEIEPFKTGVNDIIIHFEDNPKFERVHVKFAMPPQWKVEHTAFDLGKGNYKLTGNFLHTAGAMYMEVEAITSDGGEFVFPFRVQIPGKIPEWVNNQ